VVSVHPEPVGPPDAGDDAEMELLLTQSTRALARAGITAEDFLEALPAVRAEIRREIYGEGYLREIERRVAAYRQAPAAQLPREE